MNIVVLDGHTLNPGDLSWRALERLGNLTIYQRSTYQQVVPRASEADIVLVNKAILDQANIAQLSRLQFIGVTATGYNTVDIPAAKENGIVVANVPAYGSPSVAQHTFGLILALTNHVERHQQQVASGGWATSPDWSYALTTLTELKDKTLGIVGLGQIGRQVARIAGGFGMNILAFTRSHPSDPREGIELVGMDKLFTESDIISLHCPLNEENHDLVNKEKLSLMKGTSFLINTARGPLINEADLAWALKENVIAGAGLDVLGQEPPPSDHPLVGIPNCVITPHHAWATYESRKRLMEILVGNVKSFLEGNPVNVVS